jgi:tetratricopeptide (TPR) repeat protein
MLISVPFVHSLAPALGFSMFLSAGALGTSVTSTTPAYQALAAGEYAHAAELLSAALSQAPHDPYVELDLGLAYQGAGRMDLAEPFYRGAMVDGRDVVPPVTTNASDAGKSVGAIACENLQIGYHSRAAC